MARQPDAPAPNNNLNAYRLSASVGAHARNIPTDVKAVQHLLRKQGLYKDTRIDGICGIKTIQAIETYQQQFGIMKKPDGRIDPGGITLMALQGKRRATRSANPATRQPTPRQEAVGQNAAQGTPATNSGGCYFPFTKPLSTKEGLNTNVISWARGTPGAFAARRMVNNAWRRAHAGCDIYQKRGTPVYAVEGGIVLRTEYFYEGTYVIEIKHDSGFIARYGEVEQAMRVSSGDRVEAGQELGKVGVLKMLHFEMYRGTQSGELTQRTNTHNVATTGTGRGLPFLRRNDLIDPTDYLNTWMSNPVRP